MPTPSERFTTYVNSNLYSDYRRPFRTIYRRSGFMKIIKTREADTRLLFVSGRDRIRDAVQPIFGYFAGEIAIVRTVHQLCLSMVALCCL